MVRSRAWRRTEFSAPRGVIMQVSRVNDGAGRRGFGRPVDDIATRRDAPVECLMT